VGLLFQGAETRKCVAGGPIDKLSVVFVAIIAALLLSECLSPTIWLGIVLITVGAMLVTGKSQAF
jgi:transporter family protein